MITDAERERIRAHLDAIDYDALRPLSDAERAIVSRALAPVRVPERAADERRSA